MTGHPGLMEFVREAIALACNRDEDTVLPETSLLALNMDSLTLVSVLARVEAEYDCEVEGEQVLQLLEAPDLAGLVERLGRFIEAR